MQQPYTDTFHNLYVSLHPSHQEPENLAYPTFQVRPAIGVLISNVVVGPYYKCYIS